jgi:hypothetical protein
MRLGGDYRVRERLADALIGPLTPKPDPWPMVATFCAGIALGTVLGVLLAQSEAQRQVIALTGRARDLGTDLVGRARTRLDQGAVLEVVEPESGAPAVTKKHSEPAPVGSSD